MKQLILLLLLAACGALSAADSPYGICAHLQRWEYDRAEEEMALMKKAGIPFVRFDLDWDAVETAPGKWNFDRWDSLAAMAEKNNMNILPILGYGVKWASPAWQHMPEWLRYVQTAVDRYGSRMPYMEVWNEQNLKGFWRGAPDGKQYAELLIPTYKAIKERNPAIQVVYGGTAGIPMEYIEASFRAGAAAAMDVMAIHPYRWRDIPEASLAEDIAALRALMAKYGAGDKPIWFTEDGYPTAPGMSGSGLVSQLFAAIDLVPERTTVVFFGDSEYRCYNEKSARRFLGGIAGIKEFRGIRLRDIASLPADAKTLLVLPDTETFPADCRPALLDYVKRGGRVLSPGGLPFYYETLKNADGRMETKQVDGKYMPEFHMNWYAFWTRKGTPEKIQKYEYAPEYAKQPLPPFQQAFRFFDGANLKTGDRFEPLLYGVAGEFRGALAGVYHFDSDLKGKIAVCGILSDGSVDPDGQAELLPRTMLIAFGAGTGRIYWYSFRSTERDSGSEAHFGIIRRDLTPKPAYFAYQTLTKMYPAGSTGLTVRRNGEIYTATWKKPDGSPIAAVWSPAGSARVVCSGTFRGATDHLGKKVEPVKKGNAVEITAGTGVIYLDGQLDAVK